MFVLLQRKPLMTKQLRLIVCALQDWIATCQSISETMRKYITTYNSLVSFGGLEGEMYDDDEIELNS